MLLRVPLSALLTIESISSKARLIQGSSVNGILAADLAMNELQFLDPRRMVLASSNLLKECIPLMWPIMLQVLLPPGCASLIERQKNKISRDWTAAASFLQDVSYDQFMVYWFVVSTRTFCYAPANPVARIPDDPDDCLALVPFADYFIHADLGCKVAYPESGFEVIAHREFHKGEELYVSYGKHSNDFLRAEYGFILDENQWDEIALDDFILPLFSAQQKEDLKSAGFLENYRLDQRVVCYRTQVALRRLTMPRGKWQRVVKNGIEHDRNDEYASATNEILSRTLAAYSHLAYERLLQISKVDVSYIKQRELLAKRWTQIAQLLEACIGRSSRRNSLCRW